MANSSKSLKKNIEAFLNENRLEGRKPSNQTELAEALNVTPQSISKILKSDTGIRLDTLDKIAVALGTSPLTLISGPSASVSRDEALAAARLLRRFFHEKGASDEDVRRAVLDLILSAK